MFPGNNASGFGDRTSNRRQNLEKKNSDRHLCPYFDLRPELKECRRRDSNPHTSRHHPLKMACLPVPPLRLVERRLLSSVLGQK